MHMKNIKNNNNPMPKYGYTKQTGLSFNDAIEKVKLTLQEQGFGILTEIDVKATMKKKLDKDIEDYVILGACNPQLAAQALDSEKEIGLLLPCNVIVYAKEGLTFASAIKPSIAMSSVENQSLSSIATQAEQKLQTAIDNI